MEAKGATSVDAERQQLHAPPVDESLVGKRIIYCSNYDVDEKGDDKMLRWCGGTVLKISDGTWIIPTVSGRGRKCYGIGEAADVEWDPLPDANFPGGRCIEPFDQKKWNRECHGGWMMDLGDYDYGV